jgi:hypothetical protein
VVGLPRASGVRVSRNVTKSEVRSRSQVIQTPANLHRVVSPHLISFPRRSLSYWLRAAVEIQYPCTKVSCSRMHPASTVVQIDLDDNELEKSDRACAVFRHHLEAL